MPTNNTDSLLEYVLRCIERNKEARKPVEWRWYENAAFAAGFSSIEMDPRTNRPMVYGGSGSESSNPQVQDKLRKYHAKLVAPRAMPECIPSRNDRDARKRAEMANALILHFWEKQEYVYSDHAAKLNMMVFGNGIWATQWNPRAGEWVTEFQYDTGGPAYEEFYEPTLDEEGNPLLVDAPLETVRKPKTDTYQTGLPQMRSVHPFNFFPDPQWRHLTTEQCMNYGERKLVPFSLMKSQFPGVDMDKLTEVRIAEDYFLFKEVDDSFGHRSDYASSEESKMAEVFDFYHAPIVMEKAGINYPHGFRAIVAGRQVLELVPSLPYKQYPHTTFRDRQYSDRGWGMCITDVLRSSQKRLDLVERIQIRAAERFADPPMLKPQGGNDVAFQGRPGEIYEYIPYGEEKPTFMMPPQLPPNIFHMRADAMNDMESLSLTSAPVGGSVPARGDSAAYLDRLLEENQVAMAPTVQEIEVAQAKQATQLIRLCQDHLPIGYKFAVAGTDKIPLVKEFDGNRFDLLEVRMVPGSAAMTYPQQMRSSIMQLAANGILQDESPKSIAIAELMLGAPMAAKLRNLDEPGDKSTAELNIMRIRGGQEPFFKEWMDHNKHIMVLLENMRDPKFFLDFTVDQQQKLEQLLQRHQAAIAPPPQMAQEGPPGGGQQGAGGLMAALGAAAGGGQPPATQPVGVPAEATGYTGPLGGTSPTG